MIKPLHPTLKACKCGFIGSRAQLYKHLDLVSLLYLSSDPKAFWNDHGESVLNVDDPRLLELFK
jgi:hypothetical protein